MTEPKDTRRGEVPELVEDEDILALEGTDRGEKTGEFAIEEIERGHEDEAAAAGGEEEPQLLDESDLDEDTNELEQELLEAAQAVDSAPELLDDTADDEPDESTPPPEAPAEVAPSLPDTLDEPLVSRRRARRRISTPEEREEATAESPPEEDQPQQDFIDSTPRQEAPPWQQSAAPAAEKTVILGQGGADEKTQILGQESQQQPVYPLLVVVQGEEEGREIELVPDQLTVGRGTDCDLVFPDIACSRRHATLERSENRVILTDLRSGNGTLVNGKRIQQVELKDGDEVQIGTTVLRFQYPLAVAPVKDRRDKTVTSQRPMPANTGFLAQVLSDPRRRKLVLFGGGGVLGLMLVLMIAKLFAPSAPAGPSPEQLEKQREAEETRAYNEHLDAVKNFIADRRWQDASLEVQLALKLRPNDSILAEYRSHIDKEQDADGKLREAVVAMGEQNFEKALLLAKQVPTDSGYSDKAKGLVSECEQKIIEGIIAAGKQLMEEKNYAQASLKFDEALRRNPEEETALKLKVEAEKKLAAAAARLAWSKRQHKRKPVVHTPPKPKGDALSAEAMNFYRAGDLDRAIGKADSDGASRQVANLKKLQMLIEQGKQMARSQGEAGKAVGVLEQALKMDKSISGGSGKISETLRDLLSKCYFLQGADAKLGKRYPEAYKAFRKAESFGNQLAGKNLEELKKIAKRLYEEAYIIKTGNPDQAIGKLEVVLQIIPADDPYYGKAQKVLNQLRNPGAGTHESDTDF